MQQYADLNVDIIWGERRMLKKGTIPCVIILAFVIMFNIFITISTIKGQFSKKWRPCSQPNSTWVSDDNNIIITIDSQQRGKGIIKIGDKKVEFIFTNGPGSGIDLYSMSAEERLGLNEEEHYEHWIGDFVNNNKFIVTVKETTFFTVGEKITFYKEKTVDGS